MQYEHWDSTDQLLKWSSWSNGGVDCYWGSELIVESVQFNRNLKNFISCQSLAKIVAAQTGTNIGFLKASKIDLDGTRMSREKQERCSLLASARTSVEEYLAG